jgi:conjugative transfer signal peptidase TraF
LNKTFEKWGLAFFFLLGTTIFIKLYSLYVPYGVRFVYTPSIPKGLYLSKTFDGTPLERGQGVCFRPHPTAWIAGRNYVSAGEDICKFALGLPGDVVSMKGDEVVICHGDDCHSAGKVRATDSENRPMQAAFTSKVTISPGQYYFGSTFNPKSLDSRYLGLVSASDVATRTWPIWTE